MDLTKKLKKPVKLLWFAMLVSLPITSFPLISESLGGVVLVSPLAMIPMLLVVLLGVFPALLQKEPLPRLTKPIFLFAFLAFISACMAFLLPIFPYKGQSILDRELRAGITLMIGLGFYISVIVLARNKADILSGMRAIYIGLFLVIVWSAVQTWTILDQVPTIPHWISTIHRWFSIHDPYPHRVTGLAYEPSWFGNQLVIIYLPLLIGSIITGESIFQKRIGWVSIELLLGVSALLILIMTKSRISLLSFSAIVACLFAVFVYRFLKKRFKQIASDSPLNIVRLTRLLQNVLLITILIALLTGLGVVFLWGVSQLDDRMTDLFEMGSLVTELRYFYPNDVVFAVGHRLTLAERFIYWATANRIFSAYPLLGVGPGNAGFFFQDFLPVYGHQLVEIQNVLTQPMYGFPNPKSLWFRILAENGIVGFISLMVWLILLASTARALIRSRDRFDRFIGISGAICLIAQIFEGFSLDTYALPQLWIMLGLLTAWGTKRLRDFSSQSPVANEPLLGSNTRE